MALTGDYYVGEYEGHTVELIRNNWNKTLMLLIDGEEAVSKSCMFPGHHTLTATVEHNGVRHSVVARSVPYRLVFTKDGVELDGTELPITYEKPRGLLKAVFKAAWQGHPASAITVGAITLSLLALLGVMAGFVIRGL
jgi:hypothetical protein